MRGFLGTGYNKGIISLGGIGLQARIITAGHLEDFARHLRGEERSAGTVENYLRHAHAFVRWAGRRPVDRELAAAWREHLVGEGYAPASVNAMLAALNGLLGFLGWEDCRVKFLKLQRRLFREPGRELSRGEYQRLLDTAQAQGKVRLALVMEAICATGIRVSEVKYLTIEAAQRGRAEVRLKGKIRTILIPSKLARKLLKYAKGQKITSGEIFLTGRGKGLSRRQIWWELKQLCAQAGVAPSKVFPHNLRHLFATIYYRAYHDIAKLADLLGHSSLETTRIYLATSGTEHCRQLERLGLVS